jgi:hypothetical protein
MKFPIETINYLNNLPSYGDRLPDDDGGEDWENESVTVFPNDLESDDATGYQIF